MKKTNYSVARVQTYTRASILKAERQKKKKNTTYSNMNVDLAQTQNNVHYKKCDSTYNERLKEMINAGDVSLRGLKDNAKIFDEIIFDINSDYFEQNGGYAFAKEFYEKAFHFAEQEMGANNIISAVMHADELNTALTEEYGKPIYHYHLHVIAMPVVRKEIKWSKRCKDKSLIGTTKEIINQVSHSKKWKSEQATDLQGNPLYSEKGKAILIKSYSLLQDRFFQYMSDSGYRGFIRGEKGSTAEHLSDLEFKAKKEKEKLEAITDNVKQQQTKFAETTSAINETENRRNQAQQELNEIKKDIDNYKGYKGKIDNIDVGKSKLFGKKVELDTDDYQNLVKYAKKGIASDVEITKLKEENKKLKHDFNELKEKAKDFIRAIAYAPIRVADFFKALFKEEEEEQEKQKQIELAKRQRLEKLYTPAEIKILENLTDYDKEYLNRFTGETRERVEEGLIREYQKEIKYQEKINSPEYKKRMADRNAR